MNPATKTCRQCGTPRSGKSCPKCGYEEKRGGRGRGAGRSGKERPPEKIDGRSVEGQNRAARILDALNRIDPQLMEDLDLIVNEVPIEIPKDAPGAAAHLERLEAERKERLQRKRKAIKEFRKLSFEVQGWARLYFSLQGLDTRKWLYDKADGKAVQTINHVHDKPVQHEVTISLWDAVSQARKRVHGK